MTHMRWHRVSTALWRSVLDEVVVLVPDSREPVVLGGLSAAVWHALADGATADQVAQSVRRIAPVSQDVVDGTLDAMSARGLVGQG